MLATVTHLWPSIRVSPLEACRRAVVGGWDVANEDIYEDDLTMSDRLALALDRNPRYDNAQT